MMSVARCCLAILVSCLVLKSAAGQLPEVLYFPFDGGSPPQNLAAPGTSLAFPATTYGYTAGYVGNALDLNNKSYVVPGTFNIEGDWTIEFCCRNNSPGAYTYTIQSWSESLLQGSGFSIGAKEFYATSRTLNAGFGTWPGQTPGVSLGNFGIGAWRQASLTYDWATRTLSWFTHGNFQGSITTELPLALRTDNGITLGPWTGTIDELRIWSRKRSAAEIAANFQSNLHSLPEELRLTELLSPQSATGSGRLSNSENIAVQLESYGTTMIPIGTTLNWSYRVDAGPQVSESSTLVSDLNFGDVLSYAFVTPADLGSPGKHKIAVTCNYNSGGLNGSSSQSFEVDSTSPGSVWVLPWSEPIARAPQPYFNDSPGLPQGWEFTSTNLNNLHVFRRSFDLNGHTDTSYTTADSLIEISRQLYNYAGPPITTSILSPWIELSAAAPRLGFWLNTEGIHQTAAFSVHVEDLNTGVTTADVFSKSLTLSSEAWHLNTVDLSAFAGHLVRLHFSVVLSSNSAPANCKIRLDDFNIIDLGNSGSGQSPQPNLAEFEINYSFGSGHDRPRSQDAGPYFAETRSGDLIHFQFRGEPNQWIALFWGALNPASINYGPIGLCDVGTGYDFATGLPANIWVIANGFAPTQPLDSLFQTDISGKLFLTTVTPPLSYGSNGAFQSLFTTTNGNWFALSNAVELMVR